VPRLAGPAAAVRFVVANPLRQNRMLTGPEAVELGLADRLLEPVEFLDDSIAFALELADRPLVRPEPDSSELEKTMRRARAQVDGFRYDQGKARFLKGIVTGATGYEAFAGCDLVLEAVFEELAVKKEVFAELERVVSTETILATNTSSLSVTDMAADLDHPDR